LMTLALLSTRHRPERVSQTRTRQRRHWRVLDDWRGRPHRL